MGHSKYLEQLHLIAESTKLELSYNWVALVDSLENLTESVLF